jgi:signal transduction histidine kinase
MPGADPALRAAYEAESTMQSRQGAQTMCLLAIHLVPLFGVLDAVVFPEHIDLFLRLRLACVILNAGVLWLLQRPFGHRHAVGLGVVVALSVAGMVEVMVMVTGAAASPYYAGLNIVLLAVALLMTCSPAWSLLTSCLILAGYFVPVLVSDGPLDRRLLVNNGFFLVGTALIAVLSVALRERLRWREFSHRMALVEALRHKSDFMARMSHELRTPIHVMIGYADILLEDELVAGASEARKLVEGIRSHGVGLHRLISDLLDFAKIEAGRMDVQRAPLAVTPVIEHVAERFRPIVERKGLDLRTRCPGGLPAILADEQRLEQILTNLVGNAVKFTERGGIAIEARAVAHDDPALARFTFLDEGQGAGIPSGVAILIRDSGIGIRAEELARLASDFEQLDEATAARYGGTGLGLSISRRLVGLLGGRMAVDSRHGEGSTFVIVLPAAASEWPAAA